jgi:hypothetical protein
MDAGKRAPAYQLLAQSGPGLSALPMVVHGARNGLYPSPVTNRVRDADHEGENVMQKAMMQMHDAGWVGRDLPTIATTALTASGLSVGDRMPPVRQPGWLFQSCKALEGLWKARVEGWQQVVTSTATSGLAVGLRSGPPEFKSQRPETGTAI